MPDETLGATTPAQEAVKHAVDEYGLLGVVSVLTDLYGSAAVWDVLVISDRDDPAPTEPIHD